MALGWGALKIPIISRFFHHPSPSPVIRKKSGCHPSNPWRNIPAELEDVFLLKLFWGLNVSHPKTKALMTTYMEHMKIPFGRLTFLVKVHLYIGKSCKFTYYWQYTSWSHWWQGCQVTKVLHGRLREKDHFLSSGNTRAQLNRAWDTSREWKW